MWGGGTQTGEDGTQGNAGGNPGADYGGAAGDIGGFIGIGSDVFGFGSDIFGDSEIGRFFQDSLGFMGDISEFYGQIAPYIKVGEEMLGLIQDFSLGGLADFACSNGTFFEEDVSGSSSEGCSGRQRVCSGGERLYRQRRMRREENSR